MKFGGEEININIPGPGTGFTIAAAVAVYSASQTNYEGIAKILCLVAIGLGVVGLINEYLHTQKDIKIETIKSEQKT